MRQALDSHIRQAVEQTQFSGSVLVPKAGEMLVRRGATMCGHANQLTEKKSDASLIFFIQPNISYGDKNYYGAAHLQRAL
ncbi:hypothetical protein [Paenibacillus apiarius]|uniref:hypothetical protein n=1 Tax=Paenibacillus apiarius TaxID=46240 RepID=UPI00197DCFB1|nr:hypothetical protein [Paenibacillus apiarius]MBN3526874.1 hypothetical protein [Paenibacillus apiarius]